MPEDERKDPEVSNGLLLSKISAGAILGALITGTAFVIANAYDPRRVVLIGLGYSIIVWGGHFMIGWGALRNYSKLMDRESRHSEATRVPIDEIADREQQHHIEIIAALAEIKKAIAENQAVLGDTSGRADVIARLERIEAREQQIEAVQERQTHILGDALQADQLGPRRNSR